MERFRRRKCGLIRAYNHFIDFEKGDPIIGKKEKDGEIYVGGIESIRAETMKRYGFTHVLHCDHGEFPISKRKVTSDDSTSSVPIEKSVNLIDYDQENIIRRLNETFTFLDEAFQTNEQSKVLIHCVAGRSRSAAICAAYIMCKKGLTMDKTLRAMKINRKIVNPNNGFKVQLRMLEWNKCQLDEKLVVMSKVFFDPKYEYSGSGYEISEEDFKKMERIALLKMKK